MRPVTVRRRSVGRVLAAVGVVAVAAVPGCSTHGSPKVAVHGVLVLVGGRYPGNNSAVAGTVTFVDTSGKSTQARAGADGRFTVEVAPGTYTVTGSSSRSKGVCRTYGSVVVPTGTDSPMTVFCPKE